MGYSIYWEWNVKTGFRPGGWFRSIQEIVKNFYECELQSIFLDNDPNRTLLDVWPGDTGMAERGSEGDKYFNEPFSVSMLDGSVYETCKTRKKPYDKAVKLALIKAQKLSDDAWEIGCDDGGWYTKDTVLKQAMDGTWLPSDLVEKAGVICNGD